MVVWGDEDHLQQFACILLRPDILFNERGSEARWASGAAIVQSLWQNICAHCPTDSRVGATSARLGCVYRQLARVESDRKKVIRRDWPTEMIQVTRREFEKGWARARSVYMSIAFGAQTNNAHRLLLFYAVENGLKALIMRMERMRDGEADFSRELHNLNRLLDRAGAGAKLRIASNVLIRDHVGNAPRNCGVGDINQMWRYGCVADSPTDAEIESELNTVAQWIDEQLAAQ